MMRSIFIPSRTKFKDSLSINAGNSLWRSFLKLYTQVGMFSIQSFGLVGTGHNSKVMTDLIVVQFEKEYLDYRKLCKNYNREAPTMTSTIMLCIYFLEVNCWLSCMHDAMAFEAKGLFVTKPSICNKISYL